MPYRNKEDKTRWDREHRRESSLRLMAAARWADKQIATLEQLRGERHSRENRKLLRRALVSQFLRDEYGEGRDRPLGTVAETTPTADP